MNTNYEPNSLSGVLKAIRCGEQPTCNRILKDTVIFNAADFFSLVEKLQLDLHEPPVSQVTSYSFDSLISQANITISSMLNQFSFLCSA